MKRRDFIRATLIGTAAAVAPTVGRANSRLYGPPGCFDVSGRSVNEKFMLPLARAGVPFEVWRPLNGATLLLEEVLTSPESAAAFARSPKATLQRFGLDSSEATLEDEMIVLLTALSHPAVQESLANSDYESAFSYLEAAGLNEKRDPSDFYKRVEELLANDIDKIKEGMSVARNKPLSEKQKAIMLEIISDGATMGTEDDLATLGQVLSGDMSAPHSGVAVAVLAVAVAVVVGVGIAVHVSVVVSVTVAGSNPMISDAPPLFTGASGRFDPALIRNIERASRIGVLTNNPGLQVHAVKALVAEETEAVLRAAAKLRLIDVPDASLPAVITAATRYSCKALGIQE